MIHIGKNIRWLLKHKGKSQRALGKYLGYTDQGIQEILKRKSHDAFLLLKIGQFIDEPISIFFEENIESSMNKIKEPIKEVKELQRLRKENKLLMEIIQLRTN